MDELELARLFGTPTPGGKRMYLLSLLLHITANFVHADDLTDPKPPAVVKDTATELRFNSPNGKPVEQAVTIGNSARRTMVVSMTIVNAVAFSLKPTSLDISGNLDKHGVLKERSRHLTFVLAPGESVERTVVYTPSPGVRSVDVMRVNKDGEESELPLIGDQIK